MVYLKLILELIFALSAILYRVKGGAVKISPLTDESSDGDRAKFFWNLKSKAHNSVVVVANFSAEDENERSSKKIGLDSLSPDQDKTVMFINQYHVTEPDIENIQTRHLSDTFSSGSFFPSLKLPTLFEKKTITLTTTLLQKLTVYNTVYPSCLLLQNVQSVCDGVLKTVLPTRIKPTADIWHLKKTASIESVERNEDAERFIQPSSTISIQATNSALASPALDHKDGARKTVFSSQWSLEDDQNSDTIVDSAEATPILSTTDQSIRSEADDRGRIASFLEPEVRFATKYLTIAATETRLNAAHTATIIAQNCLPADLHIPLCSSYPFPGEPVGPFVVHPLSLSASVNLQQPKIVDFTIDDAMKRTVDKMRAQMRDVVLEDVRRMTDETGEAPRLFQRVGQPDSGSPIYIRENRSVGNDSHPRGA